MKRFLLALVIPYAACAPPDVSVRLLGASELSTACSALTNTLGRGSINLALTNRYKAQFAIHTDLQLITTQVGDDVLAGSGRNDFIGDRAVFNYTSNPSSPFEGETIPIYLLVPAGSGSGSFVQVEMIGTKAALALPSKVVPGGPALDLLVNFQIQGHLFSGEQLSTNAVTFPITVYHQTPACANGSTLTVVDGPCGNRGQDGPGFTCS